VDGKGRGLKLDEHVHAALDAAASGGTPKAILLPAGTNVTEIASNLSKNNYDKSKIQLLASDQLSGSSAIKIPALEGACLHLHQLSAGVILKINSARFMVMMLQN